MVLLFEDKRGMGMLLVYNELSLLVVCFRLGLVIGFFYFIRLVCWFGVLFSIDMVVIVLDLFILME